LPATIVTAGNNGRFVRWDLEGNPVGRVPLHFVRKNCTSVAWVGDDRLLLGGETPARLFTIGGQPIDLELPKPAPVVELAPDGRLGHGHGGSV